MNHGDSYRTGGLFSSNSADSESASSDRAPINNEDERRQEMIHTSQTSEHESGFYSEVKRKPQKGHREDNADGINAPFIDLEALKRLAPLFVRLPESKPTYSDPKKGGPYGSVGSSAGTGHHHYKYTLYSEKTGLIRADALLDIANATLPDFLCQNVFWLDILDPSIDEIRALAEIFRLHQLTLENMELEADDPEAREKCDVFEDYFYINLKAIDTELSSGLGPLVSINMAILAFSGMVITTHKEPLHLHRTVAKRIRLLTARSQLSADWIVYALLEDVIDFFSVSGQDIEIEVDSIDELVMVLSVNDQEDMLHRIASIRKRVVQQLRFVSNKTEILRIIGKRASHRFSEDAGFYLRDLHEHVAMLDQNMDQYDESLNRSHNNYLAQVSIEISHTSNQLNDVMKKLTVAASVALPWTVISALWGMNIDVPGQPPRDPEEAAKVPEDFTTFWALIVLMTIFSIFTYFIGRHRKWF